MKENNDPTVNWKKELLEWLKILLAAAAIALFINTCVIANTRVPSDSMETTIMAGDRLLGSRLSYRFGSHPQRGGIRPGWSSGSSACRVKPWTSVTTGSI